MSVDRVRVTEDIELAARWKHGWIPLDPEATAIKLKQGHILRHGGRMQNAKAFHPVYDPHGARIGSVVEKPGGHFGYRHTSGFDSSEHSRSHPDGYRTPKHAAHALIDYHKKKAA